MSRRQRRRSGQGNGVPWRSCTATTRGRPGARDAALRGRLSPPVSPHGPKADQRAWKARKRGAFGLWPSCRQPEGGSFCGAAIGAGPWGLASRRPMSTGLAACSGRDGRPARRSGPCLGGAVDVEVGDHGRSLQPCHLVRLMTKVTPTKFARLRLTVVSRGMGARPYLNAKSVAPN
jgi:hypothetical protein